VKCRGMPVEPTVIADLLSQLELRLRADDDSAFWENAVPVIVEDFFEHIDDGLPCFLELGVCSHWLRPHQTRWTAVGGFAWPSGYQGGSGHNLRGLPEFDWSILFRIEAGTLMRVEKYSGKRRFVTRVAVPARTARHQQAVLHVVRYPKKEVVFLGFRRAEQGWRLVATAEQDFGREVLR
jgi:hypothetical protein